jgi:cold shock protein
LKFGTADQRHPFSPAAILLSTIQNEENRNSSGRTGNSKLVQRRQGLRFHEPPVPAETFLCISSAIQAGGFKSVQEGQVVEFDVTKGPKGLQAENVKAV